MIFKRPLRVDRTVYAYQDRVRGAILGHLERTQFSDSFVREVYLVGSLVDGEFGVYCKPDKGRLASDVDLIIVGDDEFPIPNSWVEKSPHIFDLYALPNLDGVPRMTGRIHGVSAMVYLDSKKDELVVINDKVRGKGLEGLTREQVWPKVLDHMGAELVYSRV